MTALLLAAVVAAAAANVSLVTFVADRLGPKADAQTAGELIATSESAALIANENAPAALKRAA
ncbi:hypothetical protein [Methylobacterium nigriterrae]|uniref:hypothetical protein n=1 Tax=Methylobacterium nigriterrae TaxID=3127512 RepID=UPI003013B598